MRERGLPQTPLYIVAQVERRQFLEDRRNRINAERNQRRADELGGVAAIPNQMAANLYRARIQDPARREMPRAEPDQVVRSAVRDDQGRILGRYAGAITAGMTNKTDVLGMRSMMPNAPTNEGSTYQMDLMDMSTRGGATGFGLLAVDVNSRYLYGELVRDKTLPGLLAAFSRLLQQYGAMDPNKTGDMLGAPATIDTDRERAWTTPEWRAEMARRGIQHRFKTDRFSPNSLGMIDEKIKRVKTLSLIHI